MTAEEVFSVLHKEHGYCNHCGKVKCAGKTSGSTLPKKITIDTAWFCAELERMENK
jgi:predicted nucleic acid binding AN1-type Zn finger protein